MDSSSPPRIVGVGSVLIELTAFVLTIVLAITLVVGVTMFRRDRYELNLRQRVSFNEPKATYGQLVSDYMLGLTQGHFAGANATPFQRKYITNMLVTRGRQSLQLLGVTLAVALPLGIGWGGLMTGLSRRRTGRWLFGGAILLLAVPSFLILIVMIILVVDWGRSLGIQLLYTQGYGFDRHLIVPVTVLSLRGGAYLALALKAAQDAIAEQDYIRAARAKGLGGFRLWYSHMLPLLSVPLIGGVLGMLRVVVGTMILVEYLYNWGGLSTLLLQVNTEGFFNYRPEPIEVGAAVLLAVFFVVTDALGRLALWGTAVMRHEVAR